MVAGILGQFSDEILQIANEAATAEVRIKKRKQGCTPRLCPSHMTYVKKHEDFRDLLANVHFRNVWTAHTSSNPQGHILPMPSDDTENKAENKDGPPDTAGLLACERPKKIKHAVGLKRSRR